jgi:dienelactone hydrolase
MMTKLMLSLILVFGLHVIEAQQSYPITFSHDGKTVHGTFTTPDGPGRFPTVIINPGSGANDRDGTILLTGGNVECLYPELNGETLKPYKELAEALVDSGFAVLRYDKLEFTYTAAALNPITFHKLWLPVESAINYVKTRSDVDTSCLVLLGHSEGSSLIPFMAQGRTDIKALISVAGPRTPFDSILAYQLVEFERMCNGDTITAQMHADQILQYYSIARTGNCNSLPPLFGVSACVWRDYFEATDPVATNYNLCNLPTLFIGLGNDINVPPSELIRFRNEVTITDDFWSVPGLIHYMTPNDDPHVSETLTDTIIYWLKQYCMTTGIAEEAHESKVINIYPNPFTESISVSLSDGDLKGTLSVYNALGQVVSTTDKIDFQNGSSVDLSYLMSGVYFLEINLDNHKIIRRIVKR